MSCALSHRLWPHWGVQVQVEDSGEWRGKMALTIPEAIMEARPPSVELTVWCLMQTMQ